MIVFYCSKRSPTNNAWWACSLAKGHAGSCVFDRKDASGKEKAMANTQTKQDLRQIIEDLRTAVGIANDKAKTIALKLFDVEAANKDLQEELATARAWRDKAKEDAGFDRNISFDVVWAAALKAYRNGGAGWTAVKTCLPEEESGPGKGQGWTAWLECTNGEMTDSGLVVFTAAYSHMLGRWHDINQQPRRVTHYRPLPTAESIGT